jgi:hypothetical protein
MAGSTISGNCGGAAASGAQVQCLNTLDSKTVFYGAGDASGNYTIPNLPAGIYQVSAFLSGFVYYHPVIVTVDGAATFAGINLTPTALNANNAPAQAGNF